MKTEKQYAELTKEETQELVKLENDFKEKFNKRVILIAYED